MKRLLIALLLLSSEIAQAQSLYSTACLLSGTATRCLNPVNVASGGTALTSGTSGGVLAYTASGTLASSGALTANGVVLGGGAGAVPTSTAAGTNGQLLVGNTSAAPTWGSTVSAQTTFSAAGGALITGNAGATTVSAGQIGEEMHAASTATCSTASFTTASQVTLTTGTWFVSMYGMQTDAATTAIEVQYRYNSANNTTLGDGYWIYPGNAVGGAAGPIPARFQQVVSGDASKIAAVQVRASGGNSKTCYGYVSALRIQ
jgi:hypothetical protein